MSPKCSILASGALAGLSLLAGPASAHHSGAMFDGARQVSLAGTVKDFQFTNPHSWIQLDVADPGGKVMSVVTADGRKLGEQS